MNARSIVVLGMALACASVQAATRYDFSYSGLYYDESWNDSFDGIFPDAAITGYFVGEDTSGDGRIQAGELTDFAVKYNHGIGAGELVHVLGPQVPEYCLRCEITNFDYTPGGMLVFDGVISGVRLNQLISNTGIWSEWYTDYWTLTVTPQTIIRVAEVPEPGSSLMFLAGLAGLAYWTRRNARRP